LDAPLASSGSREQVEVGLDTPGKDLQLEVANRVGGHDPGDPRIGVIVANDCVPTGHMLEPAADVYYSGPQAQFVGHVQHGVDQCLLFAIERREQPLGVSRK